MGTTLNRAGYEKLIAEDIAWLEKLPHSLEKDHILAVLRVSADREYADKQQQIEKLQEALEDWQQTANAAASENCCGPDEHHCTCVPVLRKQLADEKAAREKTQQVHDELWMKAYTAIMSVIPTHPCPTVNQSRQSAGPMNTYILLEQLVGYYRESRTCLQNIRVHLSELLTDGDREQLGVRPDLDLHMQVFRALSGLQEAVGDHYLQTLIQAERAEKAESELAALQGRYCPSCKGFLQDPDPKLGPTCMTCMGRVELRAVKPAEFVAMENRALAEVEKVQKELYAAENAHADTQRICSNVETIRDILMCVLVHLRTHLPEMGEKFRALIGEALQAHPEWSESGKFLDTLPEWQELQRLRQALYEAQGKLAERKEGA